LLIYYWGKKVIDKILDLYGRGIVYSPCGNNPKQESMKQIIENKELTAEDIGSPVHYIPPHAQGDVYHKDVERGHLSSFNEHGIWVRFKAACGAKCKPENLMWG